MAKSWIRYQRGINLGGWLSQCNHTLDRYEHFITKDDIQKIASWGLDHIRVPVDYNLVETENGEYLEKGFSYIQKAIDWCREFGLNMVLDLHKTFGYSFDAGEGETGFFENERHQERFFRLWEEFARRFASNRDILAFELLNEVTDKVYSDPWNRIADNCVRRIRAIDAEIDILIGGYWNNSIDALPDLAMPLDEHIIYNFHCYDPILFTHQGAPWVRGMDPAFRISLEEPVSALVEGTNRLPGFDTLDFEGVEQGKALSVSYFESRFARAAKVAEERNVRLYCGEYGVIDRATPEDTVRWYSMIHEAFEKFGISRAAWSYRQMDFGLSDSRLDDVRDRLLPLL